MIIVCGEKEEKNIAPEDDKVPKDKITTSEPPVEGTTPKDVVDKGVKLPKKPEKPDKEKPSVTLDVSKTKEPITSIKVDGNVKDVIVVVKKKDGTTETVTFKDVDKKPIVIMNVPELEKKFKDPKEITIIPTKTTDPKDKTTTVVVKVFICGEWFVHIDRIASIYWLTHPGEACVHGKQPHQHTTFY